MCKFIYCIDGDNTHFYRHRDDMTTQTINSTEYKDLCAKYNWFANAYPSVVQNACDEFFLPGLQFVLEGISKNVNSLMDKDAYFVTKVQIDKNHDMFFRFSQKSVSIILDRALGKPSAKFNLNKLTDLEAKIITAFNDYLFNAVEQFLSPAPPTLKRTNFDVIHLTFLVKDIDTQEVGKFIITLPDVLLNPDIVTSSGDKFDYGDFSTSTIDVAVKVGTTKFKLIDVKNIEIDDIVVFDSSNTKQMVLKFKDYEKTFNLKPNLGLILPFDNSEGEKEMVDNNSLWDSIEVEMSAQFDTVKITLGELKNIEQGLVVDLSSLYDSKVTLSVENKPVARGELVIVNDRYGVKIDEVLTIQKDSQPNNEVLQQENLEQQQEENSVQNEEIPQNNSQPADEEDEFDYSDFELEDEDI